jgi:DNA replication ATP-dependent helicase Dna2
VRTGESDAGISFGDKASSDYGDDDFDDETLLGLDASILVQEDDSTMVVSSEELSHQPPPPPKVADDDFGDFDDDSLDGAEELVAEVEAKHASQHPFHGQQQKPTNAWVDDNAYGDDFDDADFDVVDLAATQATAQPFSTNVRTAG